MDVEPMSHDDISAADDGGINIGLDVDDSRHHSHQSISSSGMDGNDDGSYTEHEPNVSRSIQGGALSPEPSKRALTNLRATPQKRVFDIFEAPLPKPKKKKTGKKKGAAAAVGKGGEAKGSKRSKGGKAAPAGKGSKGVSQGSKGGKVNAGSKVAKTAQGDSINIMEPNDLNPNELEDGSVTNADGTSNGTASQTPKKKSQKKKSSDDTKSVASEKSTKNGTPLKASASRKKQIAALEEQETAINEELKKQRKKKTGLKLRIRSLESKVPQQVIVPDELCLPPIVCHLPNTSDMNLDVMISVWSFLSLFKNQLNLAPMTVDDFINLIKYKDAPSPALFEVFMALTRPIVNDREQYNNIASSLPADLHFSYRLRPDVRIPSNIEYAIDGADYDIKYNGIKLVDRRLKSDIEDPLRLACNLRCIITRILSVQQLRLSVNDQLNISGATKYSTQLRRFFSLNSGPVSNETTIRDKSRDTDWLRTGIDEFDKDALFGVTYSPLQRLFEITEAARALETKELYQLSSKDKLCILQTLIEELMNCEDIAKALERNFTERYNVVLEFKRQQRETKLSNKQAGLILKDRAIVEWLKREKERKTAEEKDATVSGIAPPKAKGPARLVPNEEQLQAMIDELKFLDGVGVDEIVENILEAETNKEASKGNYDSDEDSDEDNSFKKKKKKENSSSYSYSNSYDNRPILSDRLNEKSERLKKLAEDRIIAEKNARINEQLNAIGRLENALFTKREKDIKSAIGFALRSNLRWEVKYTAEERKAKEAADKRAKLEAEQLQQQQQTSRLNRSTSNNESAAAAADSSMAIDTPAADASKDTKDAKDSKKGSIAKSSSSSGLSSSSTSAGSGAGSKTASASSKDVPQGDYVDRRNPHVKTFCHSALLRVYKLQYEQEQQAKEEKLNADLEKKLENYPIALIPLGMDGLGREYYIFPDFGKEEESGRRVYIRYKSHGESNKSSRNESPVVVTDMDQDSPSAAGGGRLEPGSAAAFDSSSAFSSITNVVRSTLKSSINPDILAALNAAFINPSESTALTYKWGYYGSNQDIYDLIQNLDSKIECESALKAILKSRFDNVKEPSEISIYIREGSRYVGRRVVRYFDKSRVPVFGTVIGWVPATEAITSAARMVEEGTAANSSSSLSNGITVEGDSSSSNSAFNANDLLKGLKKKVETGEKALYHILHTDGDEEDLEEHELIECLYDEDIEQESVAAADDDSDGLSDDCGNEAEMEFGSSGRKPANISAKGRSDISNNVPSIISKWTNKFNRNTQISRDNLGLKGIALAIAEVVNLVANNLKERGNKAFTDMRGSRREWDKRIEQVWSRDYSLEKSLRKIKQLMKDLEVTIKSVQTEEDHSDNNNSSDDQSAGVWSLIRPSKRASMLKDGWIFSQADIIKPSSTDESNLKMIGKRIRRFFRGFGPSDATVVAYHVESNIVQHGIMKSTVVTTLFHCYHDDADEEDIDITQVEKGIEMFENDIIEDDDEGAGENEMEQFDNYDDDDGDDDDDYNNTAATLWPSVDVRGRWIEAVDIACTTSELAILLRHLEKQCKLFGLEAVERKVVVPEPKLKSRTAAKATVKKGAKGGKGINMQIDDFDLFRERPTRAAARKVSSYAEY